MEENEEEEEEEEEEQRKEEENPFKPVLFYMYRLLLSSVCILVFCMILLKALDHHPLKSQSTYQ